MDLTGFDFKRLANEKKTTPLHVAREFIQLEVLRRLSNSNLRAALCFKGGTALHLIFNMDRYSEDLDFSVIGSVTAAQILHTVEEIFEGEDITDSIIKRKTVLVEMRQSFSPQNFRVKLEINTDDIVPAELKTLYSEYAPASFNLQIMRTDYLIAQKIRALIQRGKGRDFYDLWFILKTKLPIESALVAELTGIAKADIFNELEKAIEKSGEKKIAADLNAFVKPALRPWIRSGLKGDIIQLLRSFRTLSG